MGFLTYATVNTLKRPLRYPSLSWIGLGLMTAGLLLAAYPLFANLATVLYTFYPPLLADWTFYVGLVLIVVGSWFMAAPGAMVSRRAFGRERRFPVSSGWRV